MWKNMNVAKHKFLKCKSNSREKYYRKQTFINSRKLFDKELRRSERLYNRKLLKEIDSFCIDNPRSFWDYIKKIGPRKVKQIPMQVYQDNVLVSDIDVVLNKWRSDFSELYNKPGNINEEFDQDFYNQVLNQK